MFVCGMLRVCACASEIKGGIEEETWRHRKEMIGAVILYIGVNDRLAN